MSRKKQRLGAGTTTGVGAQDAVDKEGGKTRKEVIKLRTGDGAGARATVQGGDGSRSGNKRLVVGEGTTRQVGLIFKPTRLHTGTAG
jgi:hypothetical protein